METVPKYPRTPHLPWSLGKSNDDRVIASLDVILKTPCVITEKLDGSNVCLTSQNVYARSHLGSPKHSSFDMLKQQHATIKHLIPNNESWYGEWTYAVHSITYNKLPFLNIFAIKDENSNTWKSWNYVMDQSMKAGLFYVPVISFWNGGTEKELKDITFDLGQNYPSVYGPTREGVVIKVLNEFNDKDFGFNIAKWVRKDHVQTDDHWSNKSIIRQNGY